MSGPVITKEMTVREVLTRYPHLVSVFESHGLSGCGGPSGPVEPIELFASVHKVDAQALIRDLNDKALLGGPAPVTPQAPTTPSHYRLFLKTSLVLVVAVGLLLGVVALASRVRMLPLGWYGQLVPVHGQVQMYGWVSLFLMGVAYQVLPRFVGRQLLSSRLVLGSYGLVVSGMALWAVGSLMGEMWVQVAAGALEVMGAAMFAITIWDLAFQGTEEFFSVFLGTAALWFLVATGLSVVGRFPGQQHFRAAAEHLFLVQFAGMFILGVAQRTLPFFLGLRPNPQSRFLVVWFMLNVGVAIRALGLGMPGAGKLALLGSVVEGLALLFFVYSLNIFRRSRPGAAPPGEGTFGWFIRAAFAWLIVAVVLETWMVVRQLTTGEEPSLGLLTAFRHAFALGFVTMAIVGMASRIVPVFEGRHLRAGRLLAVALWALNVGLALRVVGELWLPAADVLVPSALIAWLALALFAYSVWPSLQPAPPLPAARPTTAIGPATNVAEVIDRYPATLDVFLRHGFGPLKDEALRRTMATKITVQQVCAMHSVDLDALLRELNEAATPDTRDPQTVRTPG